MEADLVAQRCALFCLSRRHPEWTYAERLHMWVARRAGSTNGQPA